MWAPSNCVTAFAGDTRAEKRKRVFETNAICEQKLVAHIFEPFKTLLPKLQLPQAYPNTQSRKLVLISLAHPVLHRLAPSHILPSNILLHSYIFNLPPQHFLLGAPIVSFHFLISFPALHIHIESSCNFTSRKTFTANQFSPLRANSPRGPT